MLLSGLPIFVKYRPFNYLNLNILYFSGPQRKLMSCLYYCCSGSNVYYNKCIICKVFRKISNHLYDNTYGPSVKKKTMRLLLYPTQSSAFNDMLMDFSQLSDYFGLFWGQLVTVMESFWSKLDEWSNCRCKCCMCARVTCM